MVTFVRTKAKEDQVFIDIIIMIMCNYGAQLEINTLAK